MTPIYLWCLVWAKGFCFQYNPIVYYAGVFNPFAIQVNWFSHKIALDLGTVKHLRKETKPPKSWKVVCITCDAMPNWLQRPMHCTDRCGFINPKFTIFTIFCFKSKMSCTEGQNHITSWHLVVPWLRTS